MCDAEFFASSAGSDVVVRSTEPGLRNNRNGSWSSAGVDVHCTGAVLQDVGDGGIEAGGLAGDDDRFVRRLEGGVPALPPLGRVGSGSGNGHQAVLVTTGSAGEEDAASSVIESGVPM